MKRKITLMLKLLLLLLSFNANAQHLNRYEAAINKGLSEWRRHFPLLNLTKLELGSVTEIDFSEKGTQNSTIENLYSYYNKYKDFLFISPDKAYFIDLFYGSIDIEKRNGKYYGSRDIDQALFLGQFATKAAGVLARIGFCGAVCSYTDAYWIDPRNALIAGNYNNDANNYLPMISLVSLADQKVYHYFCNNNKVAVPAMYKGKLLRQIIFN